MRLTLSTCYIFLAATIGFIFSVDAAEMPVAKLRCIGDGWANGIKYELSSGFIDINKTVATVNGFGVPDGKYMVTEVRSDAIVIQNIDNPRISNVINRLSGNSSFYESPINSRDMRDGKMYFHGKCIPAKQLF